MYIIRHKASLLSKARVVSNTHYLESEIRLSRFHFLKNLFVSPHNRSIAGHSRVRFCGHKTFTSLKLSIRHIIYFPVLKRDLYQTSTTQCSVQLVSQLTNGLKRSAMTEIWYYRNCVSRLEFMPFITFFRYHSYITIKVKHCRLIKDIWSLWIAF